MILAAINPQLHLMEFRVQTRFHVLLANIVIKEVLLISRASINNEFVLLFEIIIPPDAIINP